MAKSVKPKAVSTARATALTPDSVYDRDIPPKYRGWVLADYSEAVSERVGPFLAREVPTVYLHGTVGTKKSSLAAALLRQWRALGQPSKRGGWGEFLPAYVLADTLRDFEGGKGKVAHWRDCPILVLDDLGAARNTPHITEQMLFLVQRRYDRERPTIITSNLTLAELADHLDPRAASRMQEGIVLDLGTTDCRAITEAGRERLRHD